VPSLCGRAAQASSLVRAAFAAPAVAERLSAITGDTLFLSDYPVRPLQQRPLTHTRA
jgi:hypothetical protein